MRAGLATLPLLALAPGASAQLNKWAKEAGLLYFGSATDTPGQRERAGLDEAYPRYDAILADNDEFGQTTPTNGQKWLFTEPEQGLFNFTEGDITADLAREQGKYLRCHALVWHSQLAPWVEEVDWTPETLTAAITEHVNRVAGHYRGQCYAWDVVNEAINDGDGSWRESVFYRVLGTDYIKLAFKLAAEADPEAKLYYNDYNIEYLRPKFETTKELVKMLQDDGIRIDGVGLQGHFTAGEAPGLDEFIEVMTGYTDLGVEVAFTELDVRMQLPPDEEQLALQKEDYRNAVGACTQVDGCIGITLWDFYDPFSWVPYVFPGEGQALLWFEDFSKHPAYFGAIAALKNATGLCDKKDEKRSIAQLFRA